MNPGANQPIAHARERAHPKGGFTLVELLVVVAIIGVLSSLLLPALARARSKGQGVACLNHLRQLAIAVQLYADDAQGALPYNLGAADTKNSIHYGGYRNWANNVLSWELDADNTNATWLARGGLGPYLSGNVRIFACPADNALSEIQRNAGWTRRVRSYSMNAMVGNAGSFSYGGYNSNNPRYKQFFKEAEVPVPAQIFVLIEEHPDSINDGYFLNRFWQREWFDLPASWHGGAANLTFADGHAESHRWLSPATAPESRPFATKLPMAVAGVADADFDWLMQRTSVIR